MEEPVKKPVIFVFSTAYYPFIGGAEVAIEQVARRLRDRFDFVIFTSRMRRNLPKSEIRSEGLVVRLGFGNKFDKFLLPILGSLFLVFNFKFLIPKNRRAIFWGMDLSFGSLCAAILKLFCPRVPLIFTIQYGYGDERVAKGRFGLMNLALRFILTQTDYVTAISSYLLELCKKYGFIGDCAVIHNGVGVEKFTRSFDRVPRRMTGQNPTIITVSRLVPKNGVDVLIRAIAELKRQLPISNIQLHIVGDGPERKKLEALAERVTRPPTPSLTLREGEKNRDPISVFGGGLITFHGSVPYNDLPKYLAEADVFVRPSRSEGMGNAFIEALAAGVPIVGTPVGGILDIIRDPSTNSGQATGLFANVDDPKDLAEKIKVLLRDKNLAARIVKNGQKMIAERFDWNKIAELYNNIFEHELNIKKRILIATGLFPPDVGGPATYSKILLDELPKHDFGVRVLSFGSVRRFSKILRHLVYCLKTFWMGRNVDIIFVQDPVSVGLPAALAAKILRKKFILKIVGDYAWEQYQQKSEIRNPKSEIVSLEEFQNGTYDFITEWRRKVERWVANRAKKIIVPSEYLKKIVGMWRADQRKIQVIYNACEQPMGGELLSGFGARSGHGSAFGEERSSATLSEHAGRARKAKQPAAQRLIVSAGRLVPWKGFAALIEIMPELLKKFSPPAGGLKLVIIGDGPQRDTLKSQITNHKLQTNIILAGALPREKVLEHLAAADVFALNTAYEGFSHQILEAMALGVPVVTTDAGGNPELIEDGNSGFLVKFNNKKALAEKIIKVLSDNALAQKLSENAQKKAQEFSDDRMIKETIKILT